MAKTANLRKLIERAFPATDASRIQSTGIAMKKFKISRQRLCIIMDRNQMPPWMAVDLIIKTKGRVTIDDVTPFLDKKTLKAYRSLIEMGLSAT